MTILFYLNDVEEGGETAFPVANNNTLDYQVHQVKKKILLISLEFEKSVKIKISRLFTSLQRSVLKYMLVYLFTICTYLVHNVALLDFSVITLYP